VGVADGEGVLVGLAVAVGVDVCVLVGLAVAVGVDVTVLVGLAVAVGVDVTVLVALAVAVGEDVAVLVGLAVAVGEDVGVLVGLAVAVPVGVWVAVDDGVGVADGREVIVGVIPASASTMVGLTLGCSWSARAPGRRATRKPRPQTTTTVTIRMKIVARWVLFMGLLPSRRIRPRPTTPPPRLAGYIPPTANAATQRHCVRVAHEPACQHSDPPR